LKKTVNRAGKIEMEPNLSMGIARIDFGFFSLFVGGVCLFLLTISIHEIKLFIEYILQKHVDKYRTANVY
jgi:hypothetical protein